MSIKSIRTGYKGISALAGNPVLGDYESIQTVTVASTAASLEFTSISTEYTHLQVRITGRTSRANAGDAIRVQFNSDTTNGNYYTTHYVYGAGGSTTASAGADGTGTGLVTYRIAASSATTNVFGAQIIDILDYKSTAKHKTVRTIGGYDNNGSGEIWFQSGMWFPSTIAAITTITLTPVTGANFVANTHAALYGIRG
jgi:hypothetical protein